MAAGPLSRMAAPCRHVMWPGLRLLRAVAHLLAQEQGVPGEVTDPLTVRLPAGNRSGIAAPATLSRHPSWYLQAWSRSRKRG